MKLDELTEAINRIESTQERILIHFEHMSGKINDHIEKVEPIIQEYHTSKLLKRKVGDWIKAAGMVIALALSTVTLRKELFSAESGVVKEAPTQPGARTGTSDHKSP